MVVLGVCVCIYMYIHMYIIPPTPHPPPPHTHKIIHTYLKVSFPRPGAGKRYLEVS